MSNASANRLKAEAQIASLLVIDPVSVETADLRFPIRVTAPMIGQNLPIILFSHGAHLARTDYQPLVAQWARHGFVVLQPSHPDEFAAADDLGFGGFWRTRIDQMRAILDLGERLFTDYPMLKGHADWSRVIAVGHSFGGHTVQCLLGARCYDSVAGDMHGCADTRVRAGVILAGPGDIALDSELGRRLPYIHSDWSQMNAPALIICGGEDHSVVAKRDWTWHRDPYTHSPGPKDLLVAEGAGHYLCGIQGPKRAITGRDEDEHRVAGLADVVLSYLNAVFQMQIPECSYEQAALDTLGFRIERKKT